MSTVSRNNNCWKSTPLQYATDAANVAPSSIANLQSNQVSFMSTETAKSDGNIEEMEFQAETRQLLDIVTHSLYTDKEVFLR